MPRAAIIALATSLALTVPAIAAEMTGPVRVIDGDPDPRKPWLGLTWPQSLHAKLTPPPAASQLVIDEARFHRFGRHRAQVCTVAPPSGGMTGGGPPSVYPKQKQNRQIQ